MSDREFREKVSVAVQPLRSAPASQGKVQAIRTQMAATPGPLRLLLKQVGALHLQIPADHPLELALATLGKAYDEREPGLMPWEALPAGAIGILASGEDPGGAPGGLRGRHGDAAEALAPQRLGERPAQR